MEIHHGLYRRHLSGTFGTLVLYYAQLDALGGEKALSWLYLHEHAKSLNPAMTKLARCLCIGYGTKAGMRRCIPGCLMPRRGSVADQRYAERCTLQLCYLCIAAYLVILLPQQALR